MANNKIEHHSNECVHTHTKQLHYQTFRTSRSNSEGLSLVRWNFFEAPFVALFMIDCMATQTMRRMQSKYHSATMNDEQVGKMKGDTNWGASENAGTRVCQHFKHIWSVSIAAAVCCQFLLLLFEFAFTSSLSFYLYLKMLSLCVCSFQFEWGSTTVLELIPKNWLPILT